MHPVRFSPELKKRAFLIYFFIVLFSFFTSSSPSVNVESFGSVIVLENGRKKPIDTYARNKLLQFCGRQRIAGQPALSWFCRLLFDPSRCDFDRVFLINDPQVAQTLGITPQKKRRYSYAELSEAADAIERYYKAAGEKTVGRLSAFEKEIVRIYNNLLEYRNLASTYSFLLPVEEFRITDSDSATEGSLKLSDTGDAPSYFDMIQMNRFLADNMMRIHRLPADSFKPFDRAIVRIVKKMYEIGAFTQNPPPHIIPLVDDKGEKWMSPWGLINEYRSGSVKNPVLEQLIKIRQAYLAGDQTAFDNAAASLRSAVSALTFEKAPPDPALEIIYNKINSFFIARILLGIAALLAFIVLFTNKRALFAVSLSAIIVAYLLCTVGIVMRVLIMRHPPITNLYETFIFVAWATVLIGMILELLRIRPIGLLTASAAGFIFLHIAGRYAAEGDTMGMLAAVLNSGFWLTTHIITISLGYAGCLGAAFIGHIFILHKLTSSSHKEQLNAVSRAVYGVFAFGLLFTVVGTVTGGMWAEQAWGRFWGWDPKENGALLIILWSLIVFHYRLTGRINGIGLSAGAIIAGILVMCTWIGVNLLGTGLHSYGFTSKGAMLLMAYAAFEALFLAVSGFGLLMLKNRNAAKPHVKNKQAGVR